MKRFMKMFCGLLLGLYASNVVHAQDPAPRLPTAAQFQSSVYPMLEFYKIKRGSLGCTLPSGAQVGVFLVNDPAEFKFLAVSSAQGPAILANERVIHATKLPYSVFSFYRECGVHAVSKVSARGPDEGPTDPDTARTAECLAAIPTQTTLKLGESSWTEIARLLRADYGDGASTSEDLVRCLDADHVQSKTSKGGADK